MATNIWHSTTLPCNRGCHPRGSGKVFSAGGVDVPLKLQRTSKPGQCSAPYLLNVAHTKPLLSLGKVTSPITSLLLGCWDPSLHHHMQSFPCQVTIQLVVGARMEVEESFMVPFQGILYGPLLLREDHMILTAGTGIPMPGVAKDKQVCYLAHWSSVRYCSTPGCLKILSS